MDLYDLKTGIRRINGNDSLIPEEFLPVMRALFGPVIVDGYRVSTRINNIINRQDDEHGRT